MTTPSSSAALTVFSHSTCHAGLNSAAMEVFGEVTQRQNSSVRIDAMMNQIGFNTGNSFVPRSHSGCTSFYFLRAARSRTDPEKNKSLAWSNVYLWIHPGARCTRARGERDQGSRS